MDGVDRTRRWQVTGHVQGIGFRWWCSQQAGQLGLRGWVRNRPDGTVEVAASGRSEALIELERRLQIGSPGSSVVSVTVAGEESVGSTQGFEIR